MIKQLWQLSGFFLPIRLVQELFSTKLILIAALTLLLLLAYGCWPLFKLWQTGLPYPKPVFPFFGNFLTIYQLGFQGSQLLWRRTLGHYYAIAQAQSIIIAITDPLALKEILVRNFPTFTNRRIFLIRNKYFAKSLFFTRDDDWKWARRIIVPTFTSHKIKSNMFPLMRQCAEKMVGHMLDRIDEASSSGTEQKKVATFSAKDQFGCFTMDVIASTAFGFDLDSYTEKSSAFVKNARKAFDFEASNPGIVFLTIFPPAAKIMSRLKFDLVDPAPTQFFAEVVKHSVEKRRKGGLKRNDYLQLLIEANDAYIAASANAKHIDGNSHIESNGALPNGHLSHVNTAALSNNENMAMTERDDTPIRQKNFHDDKITDDGSVNPNAVGFSEEILIANSLLFFLAGYETTANALSWIARMLAYHPNVQDRLKEEINEKIQRKQEAQSKIGQVDEKVKPHLLLTYEDIMDLTYLDCVIKETLRLHPPVLIFNREASEDFKLTQGQFTPSKIRQHGSDKKSDGHVNAGPKEIFIKKGTIVEVPIYALHRDEDLWSDPDAFNPSRFLSDSDDSKVIDYQCQFMPFGYGPRNCVGMRFALIEIKVGLVAIFGSGIKFVPAPGDPPYPDLTPENTKFRVAGINFPKAGIHVGIIKERANP